MVQISLQLEALVDGSDSLSRSIVMKAWANKTRLPSIAGNDVILAFHL